MGAFGAVKGNPKSARKPHGHFERTGPYGELESGDTLSCCHCRAHWEVRVGSGKTRGWCMACNAYTCGRPLCDICVPYERQLDNVDAGRPVLTPMPPSVSVPSLEGISLGGAHIFDEGNHGPGGAASGDCGGA